MSGGEEGGQVGAGVGGAGGVPDTHKNKPASAAAHPEPFNKVGAAAILAAEEEAVDAA
jgi:hypothetical protein